MAEFTGDQMRLALRESAGVDAGTYPEDNLLDATFEDLGCDSLAVLEIVSRAQNVTGVPIPEDAVPDLTTPRSVMDFVASRSAVA
jgi:minimal PKS acyl carrier protein